MALVLADRVKETSVTVGTGTFTLDGAVNGYQSFSAAIGSGNTCYYTIAGQVSSDWEVGIGTVGSGTLARTTVLSSSNGGALVSFVAGTKDVFVTYPAEKSVYRDSSGNTVQNSFSSITSGSIALTTGTISTAPSASTDIVNKTYVDGIVATGVNYHTPVRLESPNTAGNLNATYNNGASGVGATLTNAGTQVALTIDGVATVAGDRVLIYNQTNPAQNGVYTVTNIGSGSTNWVLTRATDANTYGPGPNAIDEGSAFYVTAGNTGAGETYVCSTVGTIVFGTTPITFAQISSAQIYSAGTGLTLTNTTFSITNTGTAGTYGAASQVPVFVTNAQGQVTSVTNTSIAIAAGAVSGLAPSATTDTTNASNITSGTLGTGRLSGSYTGITGVGTLAAGTWNGSTIAAAYGGTGLTTYTTGDIIYASGTSTLAKLAAGTNGYVLTMAGGVPSWSAAGGVTTFSAGTTGLTPSTATGGAVTLAGTLNVASGGTGLISVTTNQIPYGNGTGALNTSANLTFDGTTLTNTGNAIISDNSSNAALRITQVGAGNALLVEDSANPDATPFVVNAGGQVVVGDTTTTTTPNYAGTQQAEFLEVKSASAYTGLSLQNYVAGSGAAGVTFAHSRSGALGTQTILNDADRTGAIVFSGSDGTNFIRNAQIEASVDGTPGTNDMPGRLVFSTTADGASSPTERMRIDNAGKVGIGTSSFATSKLRVLDNQSDVAATYNIILGDGTNTLTADNAVSFNAVGGLANLNQNGFNATISLGSGGNLKGSNSRAYVTGASGTVTSAVGNYADVRNTGAGTLTNAVGFQAIFANSGGGALTNTYGVYIGANTAGTNNYGLYSNIAAATGAWNLYMNGTANNYMAGRLGIGSTSLTTVSLRLQTAIDGGTTAYGFYNNPTIQPAVTSSAVYNQAVSSTAANGAVPYTISALRHYSASQGTFNADSTVTNQYGFIVENSLTGATNNFGFRSDIASGTGRWNFYAAGTADNYFAGKVGVGITTPAVPVDVVAQSADAIAHRIRGRASDNISDIQFTDNGATTAYVNLRSPVANTFAILTGNTERMRIDSSGRVGIGTTAPAQNLQVSSSTDAVALVSGGSAAAGYLAVNGNARANLTGATVLLSYSTGAAELTNRSNSYLVFGTNNTEVVRITSTGGVSFGSSGTAYGSSGQVLTSNGNAPPTWTTPVSSNITATGLWENAATISSNYTIGTGNNAVSAGPITVASGVVVTVPSGSTWVVV